ncbi:MAG: aminotransferase class IV [Sandaracinaceae bacterium]
MSALVIIDGEEREPSAAVVPVLDRGFLYGDGAFEVLRTYGGRPFAMREHVERLRRSCARLRLPLDVSDDALASEVERGLAAAGNPESYVRIMITRGVTEMGLAVPEQQRPRRVLVVLPLNEQPRAMYEDGVELATVQGGRALDGTAAAGAKASNYLPNVLSLSSAQARGGYEALSVGPGGELLEGSTSNVFFARGGVVHTPAVGLGILDGITRAVVIEAARRLGIEVREGLYFPPDLYGAEEAFITSSLREVVPVVRVDGVPIGTGRVGTLVPKLHSAFRATALASVAGG